MPSNATLSSSNRASLATSEAPKAPPKARFFDKHGLDNYIINGCKAKVDEHVEIAVGESSLLSHNFDSLRLRSSTNVSAVCIGRPIPACLHSAVAWKTHPKVPNWADSKRTWSIKYIHRYVASRMYRLPSTFLSQIPASRVVGRRYKQFDWLHEQLVNKFRFICVPPLPGKQIAGKRNRHTRLASTVFLCLSRTIRASVY